MRLPRAILVVAAVALFGDLALANGRFPASVSVQTRPGNSQGIYLGTTFGLLVSQDDGASFHWLCENSIGYGGTFDPKYAIATDGTIYATTFDGLRASKDGGCTFETVALDGQWVDAIEIGNDGTVWIATSSGGLPNDVFKSTDNGATFNSVGLLHPSAWWKSIRTAPSNPNRVYVAGYLVAAALDDGGVSPPGVLAHRSDDGGMSWTPLSLTGIGFGNNPQLRFEGVLPSNPDVVFVRAINANAPLGDAIYRSVDAGVSFTKVLDSQDTINAFAIREDGSMIAGTINDGVYVSTDGGDSWNRPATQPLMACVTERDDGKLFACGANWDPDQFTLGSSGDAMTWTKVVRFSEIAGPLSCAPGTVQYDTCEAKLWPSLREQFGIGKADAGANMGDPDASVTAPPENGGCCDSGSSGRGLSATVLGLAVLLLVSTRRKLV